MAETVYAGCGEKRDGRAETYFHGRAFCSCDECDEALTALIKGLNARAVPDAPGTYR